MKLNSGTVLSLTCFNRGSVSNSFRQSVRGIKVGAYLYAKAYMYITNIDIFHVKVNC